MTAVQFARLHTSIGTDLRSLPTPGASFYPNNRFSINSAFCFPIPL